MILAGTRVMVPSTVVGRPSPNPNGWPGTVSVVTNANASVVLDDGGAIHTESIGVVVGWIATKTPNVSPHGGGVCPDAPDAPGPLSRLCVDNARVVRTLFT